MKHLVIIGARGFGREIFYLAQNSIGYKTDFEVKGYLDDKSDALEGYNGYPPIISSVENYEVCDDDVFICALGDPRFKKQYANIIKEKGGCFLSLIHKNANIIPTAKIGTGCIVFQNVTVSADVTVGNFVTLQPMVFLGHDAKIGDWSHLNTNCVCNGYVELGQSVQIHTNAIIVPKIKIGNNSVVGAGSVVLRKVADNVTVFGNPAKKIFG